MDKYFAVRVTRVRTDTTTVYVKLTDKAETPPQDVAKEFLRELADTKPVDCSNRFADVQTAYEAYDRPDVRAIDALPVDVTA